MSVEAGRVSARLRQRRLGRYCMGPCWVIQTGSGSANTIVFITLGSIDRSISLELEGYIKNRSD